MDAQIERVFEYEGFKVRTVIVNGEPRFVAKDVADVLGYAWSGSANIRHIPDEWKGVDSVPTPYGNQEMATLTEQGLYFFLGRSDKARALPFQKWLAGTVLPSIRKTGSYSQQPVTYVDALRGMVDALAAQEQRLAVLEASKSELAETTNTLRHRIDSLDTANIEGDPRQRLDKMVRRFAWAAGVQHPKAWNIFDQSYNTAYRTNLTSLRENYSRKNGLKKTINRPEYLEITGHIEDAIRVADKLLNAVRKAAG